MLWGGNREAPGDRLEFRHHKAFHVSPFMDMDFDYHWRLNDPAETLKVYLANHRGDERVFLANMVLQPASSDSWPGLPVVAAVSLDDRSGRIRDLFRGLSTLDEEVPILSTPGKSQRNAAVETDPTGGRPSQEQPGCRSDEPRLWDRMLQRVVFRQLKQIQEGRITILDRGDPPHLRPRPYS